jgi:hypothetical protein
MYRLGQPATFHTPSKLLVGCDVRLGQTRQAQGGSWWTPWQMPRPPHVLGPSRHDRKHCREWNCRSWSVSPERFANYGWSLGSPPLSPMSFLGKLGECLGHLHRSNLGSSTSVATQVSGGLGGVAPWMASC